jgi:hypothetical protein
MSCLVARVKTVDVLKILNQRPLSQHRLSPRKHSQASLEHPTISLLDLPDDIIRKIIEIYKSLIKYILRDWIPLNKIRWEFLSSNIYAIDFLSIPKNRVYINWEFLSQNPNAIDFLALPKNRERIDWDELMENPNAIDFLCLPDNKKHIYYRKLSGNPNPDAIELLKQRLKVNPRVADWKTLSGNPYAIDLLTLPEYYENIDWAIFSGNIGAIEILKEEYKKEDSKICWKALSGNPSACDILKEEYAKKKSKICWKALSGNPSACDIIRAQLKKDIRKVRSKICWKALSGNPSACDILKENIDKIDWTALSYNPNAIHLLEWKIKQQSGLTESELKGLKPKERINWMGISSNPSIFIATAI